MSDVPGDKVEVNAPDGGAAEGVGAVTEGTTTDGGAAVAVGPLAAAPNRLGAGDTALSAGFAGGPGGAGACMDGGDAVPDEDGAGEDGLLGMGMG